ncbi:MAG TPA: hypothetical protein VF067_00130, partial [Sphingomicrobium sp.]
MQWTSAPNIAGAPLPQRARSYWKTWTGLAGERLERLLEHERAQLPPWFVVGFGGGVAAWFALGRPEQWVAFLCFSAALGMIGFFLTPGRAGRALGWVGIALTLGCGVVWLRAAQVSSPRLARPMVAAFEGRVETVEALV